MSTRILSPVIYPAARGAVDSGEVHLQYTTEGITNRYVWPNSNQLKGIGPHIHEFCSDIELITQGTIIIFVSDSHGVKVDAPALVINLPGMIHGFSACGDGCEVFSFRYPPIYEGVPVSLNEMKENPLNHEDILTRVYPLNQHDTIQVDAVNCLVFYDKGLELRVFEAGFRGITIFALGACLLDLSQEQKVLLFKLKAGQSIAIPEGWKACVRGGQLSGGYVVFRPK